MTCREVYGFLDEFLDGSLDRETRATFERHLSRCAPCERYLKTYRATIASAKRAEGAKVNEEPPEDLIRAILASRSGSDPAT